MKISIETQVNASLTKVWDSWVTPEHIVKWNFAIDDWHCPKAEIDLIAGGNFSYRMEAKDGSVGFDYNGAFSKIISHEFISVTLEDARMVTVNFEKNIEGVKVIQTFDAEDENSAEQQKQGWQNILNNFKNYVEKN